MGVDSIEGGGGDAGNRALSSKLVGLRIADESSMKELKSLIREVEAKCAVAARHDTCNGFQPEVPIWQPFIDSIRSQLSLHSLSTTDNIRTTNSLMFIKTLSEMQISQPYVMDTTQGSEKALEEGKPSELGKMDYLYNSLLEQLFPTFLDYIMNILKLQFESPDLHKSATALHQILGIVHKSVRTSLTVLKRFDSTLRCPVHGDCAAARARVAQLAEILCDMLQNPFLECELDIKCSIGLAICFTLKIMRGASAFTFFDQIFLPGIRDETDLTQYEKKVFEVTQCTVNRIAIAFGVLNLTDANDRVTSLKLLKSVAANILAIEHGTKEVINLGSARILESWMLKLTAMDPFLYKEVKYLFPEIEFFLFNNLAGHIDAVKGCCRSIIAMVAKVYDLMEDPGNSSLVKEFLERFLHKPPHVRWAGISWTARTTAKSLCLLEMVKSFPELLLSTERIFKNAANETYLALMGYHFEVVPVQEWSNVWIAPLFNSHKAHSNESNWSQKRTIIASILKNKKKEVTSALMKYILNKISGDSMTCPEASQLAVEAVKIATELGVNMDVTGHTGSPDSFQGIISRNVLNSWLWCGNAQARIAAFSLIVDTKKTAEPISSFNLKSIKLFLLYNLVSQNPAFRQQYFAQFKKLLRRLHDSFNFLKRKRDTENLRLYQEFFKWIWASFIQDGLFPGANFARRCQTLECLAELTSQFAIDLFLDDSATDPLKYLAWLNDSYENNKIMGFKILEKLPMPSLQDPVFAEAMMQNALRICYSVKPPESVTGRYLVVFLMKKCGEIHPPLSVLTRLYHKLEEIVRMVEETSLLDVSGKVAIYGYISCIRMIFAESKEYLVKKEEYRDISAKLIAICFKLDDIFFPLLGCAAPEGTLIDKPDEDSRVHKIVRSIGAQKMLVCSWRSMRDACHLLNEMCSIFSLEGEEEDYILTLEQVESIGNHQLFLLKNLMHRGVFEQIFVGFKLLATRLYKSSASKMTKLIDKWLELALDEDLMSSKSITRRSAGLPFILQALLAPGAGNDAFIRKYVSGLFIKESDSPQVRIHIMNVLRALFRDANFSRAMMPYVPSGLRTAFKAQASHYWPEQNSGLMLLGAVVRRTFGPLLNSMSASTFFRKFPDMYEFLLGEVRHCGEKLKQKDMAGQFLDFTFYVLVLLSSFATKGVVEDAHFPLYKFIPCIRHCSASKDVRVRKVAAKALIPFLLDPANQIDTMHIILADLRDSSLNTYQIHGNLCALLAIFQALPLDRRIPEILGHIEASLMKANCIIQCTNPLVFETLVEICAEIGQQASHLFRHIHANFRKNFLSIQDRHVVPDLPNADRKIYEVQILLELTSNDCTNPCKIVYDWIHLENMVFTEQMLSFLCSEKIPIFDDESSSIIVNALVRKYVTTDFFYEGQRRVEELFLRLFCKIPEAIYSDWLNYVLESDDGIVNGFFEKVLHICEMESGTMICKALAVELLGKLACKIKTNLSSDHQERFCNVASLLCDSTAYDEIRFGVAKCLPRLYEHNNFKMFSVSQQCKLWYTLLVLAQDDEYFVREEVNSKYTSEFGTFCDIKLIENLIQLFFRNFVVNHLKEGLTLLMGLILRDDFIVAEEADDSEEERLFDKSEINTFNEPLQLAKIVREFLERNPELHDECRKVFRDAILDKELLNLYEFVSNSVVATAQTNSNTTNAFTLHDLCASQIVPKPKENPSRPLSYFVQSDKTSLQNAVREFLLDIFN